MTQRFAGRTFRWQCWWGSWGQAGAGLGRERQWQQCSADRGLDLSPGTLGLIWAQCFPNRLAREFPAVASYWMPLLPRLVSPWLCQGHFLQRVTGVGFHAPKPFPWKVSLSFVFPHGIQDLSHFTSSSRCVW